MYDVFIFDYCFLIINSQFFNYQFYVTGICPLFSIVVSLTCTATILFSASLISNC